MILSLTEKTEKCFYNRIKKEINNSHIILMSSKCQFVCRELLLRHPSELQSEHGPHYHSSTPQNHQCVLMPGYKSF